MPRYSEDELKKLLRDNADVSVPELDTVDDTEGDELKKFLRDNPGIETGRVNVYPHPQQRRNKYHARKVEHQGHVFDSAKEHIRFIELSRLERLGDISNLRLQPRYELLPAFTDSTGKKQRKMEYVADFEYIRGDSLVVEDVKSVITERNATFRLKKKLFLYKFRDNPRIVFLIHD